MAFEKFKNILGGSEPEDETNETPDEEFHLARNIVNKMGQQVLK